MDRLPTMTILHVAQGTAWGKGEDPYGPDGWEAEGFIHCCTAAQLEAVLARHFPDRSGLVVLEIDPERLEAAVEWEDTSGSGEMFPHIYGPIPRSAVMATTTLTATSEKGPPP